MEALSLHLFNLFYSLFFIANTPTPSLIGSKTKGDSITSSHLVMSSALSCVEQIDTACGVEIMSRKQNLS